MRRRAHLTHPDPPGEPGTRTQDPRPVIDRSTRSAALIATAVALPVVLVVAFLVGETDGTGGTATPAASSSGPPGPLQRTVPDLDQADAAVCGPVLATMPVTLDGGSGSPTLQPLVVTPGGPSFLAWGDPLVTLQCGVARPDTLRDDVAYNPIFVGPTGDPGAAWIAVQDGDRVTWTSIDRAVYLQVTVPTGEVGYLVDISQRIAATLPPVCKASVEENDPAGTQYCGSRP